MAGLMIMEDLEKLVKEMNVRDPNPSEAVHHERRCMHCVETSDCLAYDKMRSSYDTQNSPYPNLQVGDIASSGRPTLIHKTSEDVLVPKLKEFCVPRPLGRGVGHFYREDRENAN